MNADMLWKTEKEDTLGYGIAIGMATIVATIVSVPFTYAAAPDLTAIIPAAVFAVGGATVMLVFLLGFRRGRKHREDWRDMELDRKQAEIDVMKAKYAAPALPQPAPSIPPVTSGVAQPALIDGFDKRDLEQLVYAFTLGGKWTEQVLMGAPLPITGEVLTRERYTSLMALFMARNCISGRGGAGNPTGKLTTTDAKELIRRLNNEAPSPTATQPNVK